ncbi:MAG: hypothetical protein V4864_09440 [Pseudomonadota bacterium]
MGKAVQLETCLAGIPDFDWDNLASCLQQLDKMFDRVLQSREQFNELLDSALRCPKRSKLHETDEVRTRFVLWDHPRGNFRLRLHFWKPTAPRIIHSHRFDFAARILDGGYRRTVYTCADDLFPKELVYAPQRTMDVDEVPGALRGKLGSIDNIYSHHLGKGQSYIQTCNPKILSDTVPDGETVSLFVRGPARHDRAFQWDPDLRTVIWKRGEKDLSAAESQTLKLPDGAATPFVRRLEGLDVFAHI